MFLTRWVLFLFFSDSIRVFTRSLIWVLGFSFPGPSTTEGSTPSPPRGVFSRSSTRLRPSRLDFFLLFCDFYGETRIGPLDSCSKVGVFAIVWLLWHCGSSWVLLRSDWRRKRVSCSPSRSVWLLPCWYLISWFDWFVVQLPDFDSICVQVCFICSFGWSLYSLIVFYLWINCTTKFVLLREFPLCSQLILLH